MKVAHNETPGTAARLTSPTSVEEAMSCLEEAISNLDSLVGRAIIVAADCEAEPRDVAEITRLGGALTTNIRGALAHLSAAAPDQRDTLDHAAEE